MNVTVFLERKNTTQKIALDQDATVQDLLQHMKINPVEVVIARNGQVVTEDAAVHDKDNITIFSVISGG